MKTRELTLSALMIATLIICSQLSIPIGLVPVTLQTFAVLIVGMTLTVKNSLFVTIGYLVLGLIGLPVFANGSGGIQAVLSPSFGFAIGFIPAAALIAYYLAKNNTLHLRHYLMIGFLATLVIYLIVLSYMNFILTVIIGNHLSLNQLLMAGMIPFIPGDLLKIMLSSAVAIRLRPSFSVLPVK